MQQPEQSCIADCLLPPPAHLSTGQYTFLQTKLGTAYGECDKQHDFNAIPYVKNIDLGGGVCAQAVSYMATALLHEHATRVYGLADISALAHDPACQEICISGLTRMAVSLGVEKPRGFHEALVSRR